MTEQDDRVPIWARGDAFPAAPDGWGWTGRRGRQHYGESIGVLEREMGAQAGRVRLVWTPPQPAMVVPEEVPELGGVLRELGLRAAARDRRRGLKVRMHGGAATGRG
jgi:hypothetical protein